MPLRGSEVIVLDDDSSVPRLGESNQNAIEIDDSSSSSGSVSGNGRRHPSPPAGASVQNNNNSNEVICVDTSSGDDETIPTPPPSYSSPHAMNRKRAGKHRTPTTTTAATRPGISDEIPSPGSSRMFNPDIKNKRNGQNGRLKTTMNHSDSSRDRNASKVEIGQNGTPNNIKTTPKKKKNGVKHHFSGSKSTKSDSSRSYRSSNYLSSMGNSSSGNRDRKEDQNHPSNGEVTARARKSDFQMIATKSKPKSAIPTRAKKASVQSAKTTDKHTKLDALREEWQENQQRCPMCFNHVPADKFEKHKSTCGQDIIGEFQNSQDGGIFTPAMASLRFEGSTTTTTATMEGSNQINDNTNKNNGAIENTKKRKLPQSSNSYTDASNQKKIKTHGNIKKAPSPLPASQKVFNSKKPVFTEKLKLSSNPNSKIIQKEPIVIPAPQISSPLSSPGRKLAPKHPRKLAASKYGLDPYVGSPVHTHNTRGGSSSKRKGIPKRYQEEVPSTDDDETWRRKVEEAIRDYRKCRKEKRQDLLRRALDAKNELLNNSSNNNVENTKMMTSTDIEFPVLTGGTVTMDCPSRLDDPDYPLPRDDFTTIFLKKYFVTEEKTDLGEIHDDSSKSHSKKGSREQDSASPMTALSRDQIRFKEQIEEFNDSEEKIGVGYEEIDTDEEISQVLERLQDVKHDRNAVHRYLALLLQEEVQRVWDQYYNKVKSRRPQPKQMDTSDPYVPAMSSFRDVFCRQCLTYDCNLHGLTEDICPDTQAEIAIHRESSGYWKDRAPMFCYPVSSDTSMSTNNSDSSLSEDRKPPAKKSVTVKKKMKLTDIQKVLCRKLFQIFLGDIDKVATVAGLPTDSIIGQAKVIPFEFTKINPSRIGEARLKAGKSNAYNPTWVKRIVEAESHPFFSPCQHTGLCSEESCTCIQNGFFCTKHCIWGNVSKNYFIGCNCTAKCTTKSCPCFASNRECDPDLCRRCGTCTDQPNHPATTQPCRNDNIGMRRHVHLVMGKSTLAGAGWGLFTKYDLKKGDYVHEYLGEVITQDEAEIRGRTYDEKNQTYLFDLTSDCAIDALRKGNKTRFINHSVNPNIAPKILVVNGDFRIGFFALHDIPAQAELFFDYGKMFFSSKGSFAGRNHQKTGNGGS